MDWFLAIFLTVILALAGKLAVEHVAHGRRMSLQQQADRLGFGFQPVARPFRGSNVEGLAELLGNDSVEVRCLLQGAFRGLPMMVFDLDVYSGMSERESGETIAAFHSERPLPVFKLQAKGALDKARDVLRRKQEIEDPEFARQFFLRFNDDAAFRDFLTPERRRHIETYADGFFVQSSPEWLLIYRPGAGFTGSPSIGQFVATTCELASGLLSPGPRSVAPQIA